MLMLIEVIFILFAHLMSRENEQKLCRGNHRQRHQQQLVREYYYTR